MFRHLCFTPPEKRFGKRWEENLHGVRINRINAVLKGRSAVRGQRVSGWQRWVLWLVIL